MLKQRAFPGSSSDGMYLRDYFAGQFIVAILSHQHMIPSSNEDLEVFCKKAYEAADLMIKERQARCVRDR